MTLPATTFKVSGARFTATYDLHGSAADARARAEAICVEQTIEFPADLIGDDDIRRHVIGRLEAFEPMAAHRYRARISYAVETTGFELPQLVNVVFGNCSLWPRVRLVGLELPAALQGMFRGPRFGLAGIRTLVDAPHRPLLATALKPMGLDSLSLAAMAGTLARAGIDLIKDDHGLSNQPFAPFRERVRRCADAVHEANAQTGGKAIYLAALNAPTTELLDRAHAATDAGAGGLLVLPGIGGFDVLRALAEDDHLRVPVMAHPAFLGSFVAHSDAGIEHGLLFGTMMRFGGADLSIFPGHGGRFSFRPHACRSIVRACLEPLDGITPTIPAPGGGMSVDRVPELVNYYGADVALLIGGNLHYGDLYDNAVRFRNAAAAASAAYRGASGH